MKLIEKIKKWIESIQEYPYLLNENKVLINEMKELKSDLKECQTLQENKQKVSDAENFWLNRHPKKDITYERIETDGKYKIDVRSFFMLNFDYPAFLGKNYDDVALKCLNWVRQNIKYKLDTGEYWSFAYQTLKRKTGDCEDQSILLANIMLHNKIPAWRVRINAGNVKDPNDKNKIIGHAYVTYCRETDNNWIVLDSTYWSKGLLIADRKLHKEEKDYYNLWFSFDVYNSYGNKKYLDEMPKVFKYGT